MNRARSLATLAWLALLSLVPLVSCGRGDLGGGSDLWERSTIHQAKKRGELVVLMEAEFKPFTYKQDGNLMGFDVDLARAIAQDLGVKVRFEERAWGLLATELIDGKGDLIISGVTATASRALELSFSEPYFITRTMALLGVPKADGVKTGADLNSARRRIVAQKSSTGEIAAKQLFPKADLLTFPNESFCALEVVQGKADAFIYDEWQVREHAKENVGATRVLEEELTIEPYGIECRKGDPDTLDWLNLVIASMKRDGRLAALYAKHLPGIAIHPGLGFVKK